MRSWAIALCALALSLTSPGRSAAQATEPDDDAPTSEQQSEQTTEAVAVTTSAPAPAADEGDAAAPAEAEADVEEAAPAARQPLPWRNTFFTWTHGTTPNSFFRDSQLSYDPLYYWSFNLSPRWYLDGQTFLALSQSLSYELTNADGAVNNHELTLTDTMIELRRIQIWEGFVFIPGVRALLPISKGSQAAQRYLGLGAGLTAVRVIPEAASLTFALVGRYQYWFAGTNTPSTASPYEGGTYQPPTVGLPSISPEGVVERPMVEQASGVTTARHVITAGISVSVMPVAGLTIAGSAFWLSQEGHGLGRACTSVVTSPTGQECFDDESRTHWRHATSLSLSVAYDILPWFNLAVGWSNSFFAAPLFSNDGGLRNVFNPDNNLYLSATFQVDSIYEALSNGDDDGLTPEQRQRRRQGLSRRVDGSQGEF